MSQQITFAVRKKGTESGFTLAWWSTSIARDEDMRVAFPWCEEWQVLCKDCFNSSLRELRSKVRNLQECRKDYVSQRASYRAMLPDCKDRPAAAELIDEIAECTNRIKWTDEDIALWKGIVSRLEAVYEQAFDEYENPDWELVYLNY